MSQDNRGVAVAVSGTGRSLENLLANQESLSFRIRAVVASRECRGCDIARQAGLPLHYFGGDATSIDLDGWLRHRGVSWVLLAGFLKPFPSLPSFENRVINVHPSLLPSFGGKGMYGSHVHRAVLAAGETISGASVHWVDGSYDTGAVLARVQTPVKPGDTEVTLGQRVFAAECFLVPRVLEGLIRGTLPVAGGVPADLTNEYLESNS